MNQEIKELKEAIEYYENLPVVGDSYAQHRRDECLDELYEKLEGLIAMNRAKHRSAIQDYLMCR